MARERWFFAQGTVRRGPLSLGQLADLLLGQPEPRAVLVWRKGLADWTHAGDVPQVEERLRPSFDRAADEAARRVLAPSPRKPPPSRVEEARPARPALVYGGIASGVAVAGLLAWLLWPRPPAPSPTPAPVPLGDSTADDAPALVIPPPTPAPTVTLSPPEPTTTAAPRAAATPVRPPAPVAVPEAMSEQESSLPPAELAKLRGVAAWSGDTLRLTVYNGTAWRITRIHVQIGRFVNDDFVEDSRPVLLVPPGADLDAGVADLLNRVAPDRRKPGLNPADTGPFEGRAGQQPESFRWEIESARGYAPR